MSPFVLKQISYGEHRTRNFVEGSLDFGLIHPVNDVSSFWYSYDISEPLQTIENFINSVGAGTSAWNFTIGEEEDGLISGETKVIGVYRQSERSLSTNDYQDMNQVTQIIDDGVVLLLKIKVEKK